jgi:hypothetical protein
LLGLSIIDVHDEMEAKEEKHPAKQNRADKINYIGNDMFLGEISPNATSTQSSALPVHGVVELVHPKDW